MKLIELHILQSVPVTCLNRDDLGAPKTTTFGGVERARVSSQCWKRAVRQYALAKMPNCFAGRRSRLFASELETALKSKELSSDEATAKVKETVEALNNKLDIRREGRVATAIFFSPQEIETVAQALADGESGKKAIKRLKNLSRDAADIAIFGRMIADNAEITVEGASLFSHAISTHRSVNELDFFSAVDDLLPEDETGAAITGTLEYSSACYYRYVGLNVNLLREPTHLGDYEEDEFKEVVKTFLEASLLAVPNARRNSMFGQTLPSYVHAMVRTGQPISLANAFEKPVRGSGNGYSDPSIESLKEFYGVQKQLWGLESEYEDEIPPSTMSQLINGVIDHV